MELKISSNKIEFEKELNDLDKLAEDARHLYNIFKQHLNRKLLDSLFRKLNIQEELKRFVS